MGVAVRAVEGVVETFASWELLLTVGLVVFALSVVGLLLAVRLLSTTGVLVLLVVGLTAGVDAVPVELFKLAFGLVGSSSDCSDSANIQSFMK